jgi:large subunit ribosomal protein L25
VAADAGGVEKEKTLMTDIISIAADKRERVGKGGARETRRTGRVPAIISGAGREPEAVSVDGKELHKQIRSGGFFSHVYVIDVGGVKHRVLAREVQRHPVSGAPLHVDFMRFSATTRVQVDVDVVFVNEDAAPGLKQGGVLNIVSHSVPLICSPSEIPQNLTVDLTGLEIGDVIHVTSLTIPASAELDVSDPEATIATIAPPTVASVEEEEAEAEAAAAESAEAAEEKDEEE